MDTPTNKNNVNNSSETTPALSKHCRKRKRTQQSTNPTSQEVRTSSRLSTRTRKAREKPHEALDDKIEDVAAATSTSSTEHPAPVPSFTLTLPPTAAIDATKHLVETQDQDGDPVTMFQYDGRRFPVNARFLVPPRPYTRRKKLDPNPMASTRVIRPPPVPPAAPAGPQAIKWSLNQPPVHAINPYMFLHQNNLLPLAPHSYHHSPSVTPHVVSANASTPRTTRDVGVDTASDIFSIRTTQDITSQRLDPPRRTDFIKGVVGIELSAKSPTVQWSTGVETVLPFIHDPTKPGNNKLYKDEEPSQIASDASGAIRVPNASAENARTTVINNTENAVDNAPDRSVEAIPSVEVILKTREHCKQLAERLRRRRTELGTRGAQFDDREAWLKEKLEMMRKRLWEENRIWEQDLRHEQGEVAALEQEDAKREAALKKLTDQVEELEATVSPLTS